MSIVAFDGRYILSDSICVDESEYQFNADKVFVHCMSDGTPLVAAFVGSLSIGAVIAQHIFDTYETEMLYERIGFKVKVELISERPTTDVYIIDYIRGRLYTYCSMEHAFAILPMQSFTMGFPNAVAIVEAERLSGADWLTIATKLDAYTNSITVNARFVAPPYYVTDVKTGHREVIYEAL